MNIMHKICKVRSEMPKINDVYVVQNQKVKSLFENGT